MADEKGEVESQENQKRGKTKLFIAAIVLVVALGGAGFFGYTKFLKFPHNVSKEEKSKEVKTVLFALDPLILNLREPERFLKLSAQFELVDPSYEPIVSNKVPQLRDMIITFVSSKSAESILTPEGKMHLKDEILLRANQVIGKNVFSNVYFTEFVTQ
jgi:flagellar FliL protein